jgi:hypothetical protein
MITTRELKEKSFFLLKIKINKESLSEKIKIHSRNFLLSTKEKIIGANNRKFLSLGIHFKRRKKKKPKKVKNNPKKTPLKKLAIFKSNYQTTDYSE